MITVHPPLRPPDPDPGRDQAACSAILGPLLAEYVRRFPEQCYVRTFYGCSPIAPPE